MPIALALPTARSEGRFGYANAERMRNPLVGAGGRRIQLFGKSVRFEGLECLHWKVCGQRLDWRYLPVF
jgi:hypothetical protein